MASPSYLQPGFRRRFAASLPQSEGGLSADVALLGAWCGDAYQAIIEGNVEGYFGVDPMADIEALATQAAELNRLLRDQGFAPPDPIATYPVDPMGTLIALAEFYRKMAPLVAEPTYTLH